MQDECKRDKDNMQMECNYNKENMSHYNEDKEITL
jgi:hypothetical protein